MLEGSRYEDMPVNRFRVAGGDVYPTVFSRTTVRDVPVFQTYVTVRGDRLDQIASRFFRDPNDWWIIAALNPETGLFPEPLEPGIALRIPV